MAEYHPPSAIRHPRAFSLLSADLSSGNIAHAYIFAGPKSTDPVSASHPSYRGESGLRQAALEFAKALNCNKNQSLVLSPESSIDKGERRKDKGDSFNEPCDSCESCRKIEDGVHPDLFVLDFDSQAELLELVPAAREKQKEYHIEAIRQMIHRSILTPIESKWKIFIIEGAELLSLESANALLKSLEEPTSFSCWILLSFNFERILPTIRSRCRRILFQDLHPHPHLLPSREKETSEESPLPLREREGVRGEMNELAEKVFSGRVSPLSLSSEVLSSKKDSRKRAEEFLESLALQLSKKLRERPTTKTADSLAQILQAREDLRRNTNPQFVLEALLTSIRDGS